MKTRRKSWFARCFWRVAQLCVLLILLLTGFVVYTNVAASWVARGKVFDQVSELPAAKIGLVFGCTDRVRGRENLYFRYRIEAAVAVWKAEKIQTFIVSGDNRSRYYNEPKKMRAALIRAGVPDRRIVCDYAGLRTLDSIVRAQKIFGADRLLVISQRFQNERAIYLAQANGMEAYGFNAKDVGLQAGYKIKVREIGARVQMWLDVNFLNTKPTHLGDKIEMPE